METVDKQFIWIYVQSTKPIIVWKTKISMEDLNGCQAEYFAFDFYDECKSIQMVTLPFDTPVVDVLRNCTHCEKI